MSGNAYWVDANIILRFLTGEPEGMAERSQSLFNKAQRGELSLHVHPVIVAEVVWVLQSFYGHPKSDITDALIPLLTEHRLNVEGAGPVVRALEVMTDKNVDFADALLSTTADSQGDGVASFDRDFRKLGVEFLEPG